MHALCMRSFISLRYIQDDGNERLHYIQGDGNERLHYIQDDGNEGLRYIQDDGNERLRYIQDDGNEGLRYIQDDGEAGACFTCHPERSEGSHAESHASYCLTATCPLPDYYLTIT